MGEEEGNVDATSAEFKQGVEAGLNSEEDTKNWKAGNELGRELREEGQTQASSYGSANGSKGMYVYTMQAMPGCKAKFDGDTSVKYRVRRKHTSASTTHKSSTDDIRTGLGYEEATALVKRFNDKEQEARAIKH